MASFHLDVMMLIWISSMGQHANVGHVGGYNLAKKLILDRYIQGTSKVSSDIFCYLTISGKKKCRVLLLLL